MTSWLQYSIPFLYTLQSRLQPFQDRVSWLLIQIVPQAILVALLVDELTGATVVVFGLAVVAWQALYEIGYLENDVITFRREVNPTERIGARERQAVEAAWSVIVAVRVLVGSAIYLLAAHLAHAYAVPLNHAAFLAAISAMAIAFLAHNRIRNQLNVISYFVLSSARYSAVPLLLVPAAAVPTALLISVLMLPLPRTFEHASKKKYRLRIPQRVTANTHLFRVLYYGALTCMALATSAGTLAIIASYFLVYRGLVLVAIKSGLITPTHA